MAKTLDQLKSICAEIERELKQKQIRDKDAEGKIISRLQKFQNEMILQILSECGISNINSTGYIFDFNYDTLYINFVNNLKNPDLQITWGYMCNRYTPSEIRDNAIKDFRYLPPDKRIVIQTRHNLRDFIFSGPDVEQRTRNIITLADLPLEKVLELQNLAGKVDLGNKRLDTYIKSLSCEKKHYFIFSF